MYATITIKWGRAFFLSLAMLPMVMQTALAGDPADVPGIQIRYGDRERDTTVSAWLIPKIDGYIDDLLYTELLSEYQRKPFDYILVGNIYGGQPDASIKIGHFIKEKNISLAINGLCLSACANYLLPAAKMTIFTEKSVVGWHGGMRYMAATAARRKELATHFTPEQLQQDREKDDNFFKAVSVDTKIYACGLLLPDMQRGARKSFYYTPEAMTTFGIRHVTFLEGPAQWLARMSTIPGHYLAQPCKDEDLVD